MAWKKSALKRSQTFSCAKFDFMDMLLIPELYARQYMDMLFAQRERPRAIILIAIRAGWKT
jgi:hypothetical protein